MSEHQLQQAARSFAAVLVVLGKWLSCRLRGRLALDIGKWLSCRQRGRLELVLGIRTVIAMNGKAKQSDA